MEPGHPSRDEAARRGADVAPGAPLRGSLPPPAAAPTLPPSPASVSGGVVAARTATDVYEHLAPIREAAERRARASGRRIRRRAVAQLLIVVLLGAIAFAAFGMWRTGRARSLPTIDGARPAHGSVYVVTRFWSADGPSFDGAISRDSPSGEFLVWATIDGAPTQVAHRADDGANVPEDRATIERFGLDEVAERSAVLVMYTDLVPDEIRPHVDVERRERESHTEYTMTSPTGVLYVTRLRLEVRAADFAASAPTAFASWAAIVEGPVPGAFVTGGQSTVDVTLWVDDDGLVREFEVGDDDGEAFRSYAIDTYRPVGREG